MEERAESEKGCKLNDNMAMDDEDLKIDAQHATLIYNGADDDDEEEESNIINVLDETAEELMTDMNLDDHQDDFKSLEPDLNWVYHIMAYPWIDEDMATKDYLKLIRLTAFSNVVMKKKKTNIAVKEESDADGKSKPMIPQQKHGCLHLYCESQVLAKVVMRSLTWKSMSAKELTVEVQRRDTETPHAIVETAYLEINTYPLCKIKWRDRVTGDLKSRTAKVSNLHNDISRGFLEVILSRCFPIIGGISWLNQVEPHEHMNTLKNIEGFNGTLDFECVSKGSCRAMIQAYKKVVFHGQTLDITPNDKSTMIVPPFTHNIGVKKTKAMEEQKIAAEDVKLGPEEQVQFSGGGTKAKGVQTLRGAMRGLMLRGSVRGTGRGVSRGMLRGDTGTQQRGPRWRGHGRDVPLRGLGRAMMPLMRPVSVPFTRSAPLVPMTGRQKMNEKLRRNNIGQLLDSSVSPIIPPRNSGSVGDSFKQELSALHSQLAEQTQALEAKIAALQQSHQVEPHSYYDTDMVAFDSWDWEQDDFPEADMHETSEYSETSGYMGPSGFQNRDFHGPPFRKSYPKPISAVGHRGQRPLHRGGHAHHLADAPLMGGPGHGFSTPGSPMAPHGEFDFTHKGSGGPRYSKGGRNPQGPRYSSRDSPNEEHQDFHNREGFTGSNGFRGGRNAIARGRGPKGGRPTGRGKAHVKHAW